MWRRRYKFVVLCLSCVIIMILFNGGLFSSFIKGLSGGNGSPPNSEQNKAESKIILLTSLLRQAGVSETKYLDGKLPKIYVITPTHARPVQKAELTRLKNIFLHIPALHWIVVEDALTRSQMVTNFLASSHLSYTHLYEETPPLWKLKHDDPRWYKPRGVLQRNKGIRWLRENVAPSENGVVYFADDDNTYSIEIFDEMRYTEKVSIWPVGLVGGVMVERPSLNSKGEVDGWRVGWMPGRAFATDMAGFAVNLGLLIRNEEVYFSHKSKRGFIESDFLEKLIDRKDLEPKADRCTKVLVWHTQTLDPKLRDEEKKKIRGELPTNHKIEV